MNDLKLAARHLAKSPGFTAVAVISLAFGIGATASLFSLVAGLVLEPLPYPESERVGQVWGKKIDATLDFTPLSTPDFLDVAEQAACFAAFGGFAPRRFNLGGAQPEAIEGALCTPGVFAAFGVAPLHGRWFSRDDVTNEATTAVAILSYAVWQQRFAGDPACIGKTLRVDGRNHIVVGVMPREFQFLSLWTRDRPLGIWIPLALNRGDQNRASFWMSAIARLKPGITSAQAAVELNTIAERLRQVHPDAFAHRTFWFMPLQKGLGGLPASRVLVLLAAGWTLLVLATQNVAGMMLARGIGRQPEIALRIALGASRWRVIRLVLAESALLAVLAAVAGLVLTLWAQDALSAALPAAVQPREGLAVDGSLLSCIACLAMMIVQMAGLAPAILASKTDVVGGLKESGISHTVARKTHGRLRRLVVTQLALALMLVSIATQLSGTYRQMLTNSEALVSEQIVTAAIAVKGSPYDRAGRVAFWDRLLTATGALPGVRDVGVTSKLPFDGGVSITILIDDEAYDPSKSLPWTEISHVSPGFFAAINARLLQGRVLTNADANGHRQSVVINRALARRYWPGENPIGRRIRPAQPGKTWSAEVVGVIEDVRQVAERPAKPEMFYSFSDDPAQEAYLVLRTAAGVPPPLDAMRERLRQIDPDLAFANVQSMRAVFAKSGGVFSVITSVVDTLTVAIVGLAGLGLYGTLSFTFARRRRDIGVRLALGASARDVIMLVLRQALAWVAIGAAIGLAGSWLMSQGVHAMLEDASPLGALHLAFSLGVVATAAALASWLPARRAACMDPIEALRAD